ncbi:alpha/beta-hydrolase [Cristinia sonorae]|uniref:Alpha/beta-hydrolase n=1 Tax=Cristinia sonorae TaxID=1940300 RepID=A0A8K0UEF0_9AGAR|nr:alpha/beta-hydrolase [Cristinia sonorae]
MAPPPTSRGFYAWAQNFFLSPGLVYAVGIALLATPPIQRLIFYEHQFRWPLFANFDLPEAYGLALGTTLNLHLETPDNVTLGAWFVLSDPYYQSQQVCCHSSGQLTNSFSGSRSHAVQSNPTVPFLHGTGGPRASVARTQFYSQITSRFRANVLALDYRGFGDSTGAPAEKGVAIDAYTAWRWIAEQGARDEYVLIIGHSLGTNIATRLGKQLATEGVKPRGITLLAPFSELSALLETYHVLRMPILQPITNFYMRRKLIKALTLERYDTLSNIEHLNVPVLFAHATDDNHVKHTHSKTLMGRLLDPYLPTLGHLPANPGFEAYRESLRRRTDARVLLVKQSQIANFGVLEEFETKHGKVVYVESMWGGHNLVPLQEGVQDQIAKMFKLEGHS